ncbi:MAG: hypothetical protein M3Y35_13380, partial [Actinomycetota bacterium]|nr:hypothetical protein [Actinomycetota bacterium]
GDGTALVHGMKKPFRIQYEPRSSREETWSTDSSRQFATATPAADAAPWSARFYRRRNWRVINLATGEVVAEGPAAR